MIRKWTICTQSHKIKPYCLPREANITKQKRLSKAEQVDPFSLMPFPRRTGFSINSAGCDWAQAQYVANDLPDKRVQGTPSIYK